MSSRELHWFFYHLPMFKGVKFYFNPFLGANRSQMLGFTPNTLPLWRRMQIWSRGCPECPAARVPCRPRSRRPGGRGWATARPPTSCGGSPAGPRRCPAQTQAPAHKTTINITHNVKKIYLCHTFLRLNIENGEALAFRSTHKTMMRLHFLNSITHLTQTNISNISLRFLRRVYTLSQAVSQNLQRVPAKTPPRHTDITPDTSTIFTQLITLNGYM